jgi:hypothetical protein
MDVPNATLANDANQARSALSHSLDRELPLNRVDANVGFGVPLAQSGQAASGPLSTSSQHV